MAEQLRRYSLPAERYAALRASQLAEAKPYFTVDAIRVEGLNRTNPAVVQALVKSEPGQPITEEKVAADLRRIFGTGDYEAISYRIVGDEGGPRAMLIEPTEKSWGPDFLRFGLALASDFAGDNQFNIMAQYRRTWLNSLGAEWVSEAQVGQHTFFNTHWYQPLSETGRWFVAPSFYAGVLTRGVFIDQDKVADYRTTVIQGGIDGGARLGTWGELRAGIVGSNVNARVDTGSTLLPSVRETSAGLRAALFIDQTDHAWFPREGYGASGSAYRATTGLGSDLTYSRVEFSGRVAESWGPHTFNLAAAGGTALDSDMPVYESFTLGGPLRLSAYRLNQFAGRQYAFGRSPVLQPDGERCRNCSVPVSSSAGRRRSAASPIGPTGCRPPERCGRRRHSSRRSRSSGRAFSASVSAPGAGHSTCCSARLEPGLGDAQPTISAR